jgi:hypothetical protein
MWRLIRILYGCFVLCIADQEVDGDTLQMLLTCASMEQLQACGLKTVKAQMHFRKVAGTFVWGSSPGPSTPSRGCSVTSNSSTISDAPNRTQKLRMKEIKQLSPEEKRLYLMKYVGKHAHTPPSVCY